MAIVYVQQKKTQRNLILVLVVVFLIIAFIIWQGFFKKEIGLPPEGELRFPREEVKVNFGIFKNPLLQSLQPFPDIQPFKESTSTLGRIIIEEKLGRENPFLPY